MFSLHLLHRKGPYRSCERKKRYSEDTTYTDKCNIRRAYLRLPLCTLSSSSSSSSFLSVFVFIVFHLASGYKTVLVLLLSYYPPKEVHNGKRARRMVKGSQTGSNCWTRKVPREKSAPSACVPSSGPVHVKVHKVHTSLQSSDVR